MAKMTKQERYRRTLIAAYRVLAIDGENFLKNIDLLDAIKDCANDNEAGMEEWAITKGGRIRFR